MGGIYWLEYGDLLIEDEVSRIRSRGGIYRLKSSCSEAIERNDFVYAWPRSEGRLLEREPRRIPGDRRGFRSDLAALGEPDEVRIVFWMNA